MDDRQTSSSNTAIANTSCLVNELAYQNQPLSLLVV